MEMKRRQSSSVTTHQHFDKFSLNFFEINECKLLQRISRENVAAKILSMQVPSPSFNICNFFQS